MVKSHPFFWQPEPDDDVYDVHELFSFYNEIFFKGVLTNSCEIRWTRRMTLCAGTCKPNHDRSSVISLSEPLLKLRSNNNLK